MRKTERSPLNKATEGVWKMSKNLFDKRALGDGGSLLCVTIRKGIQNAAGLTHSRKILHAPHSAPRSRIKEAKESRMEEASTCTQHTWPSVSKQAGGEEDKVWEQESTHAENFCCPKIKCWGRKRYYSWSKWEEMVKCDIKMQHTGISLPW